MTEDAAARIKRLRMRAWRRGTREMDLILGPYADDRLGTMDPQMLEVFDRLLSENDHDLYAWVAGTEAAPPAVESLVTDLAHHARARRVSEA